MPPERYNVAGYCSGLAAEENANVLECECKSGSWETLTIPWKGFRLSKRFFTSGEVLECTAGHDADGVDVCKTRYTDRSGMVPGRAGSKGAPEPSFGGFWTAL